LLFLILGLTALTAACAAGLPAWPSAAHVGNAHTVRPGDTLAEIAAQRGTTVDQLVILNAARYPSLCDEPDLIRVGWEIAIPGRGAGAISQGGQAPSASTGNASVNGPFSAAGAENARALEREIIRLTNEARSAEGLVELVQDPILEAIARERAEEIVSRYSHDGFVEACEKHGVAGSRWLAENIAAIPASAALPGSGTLAERFVITGWLRSEGHRASILHPQFTAIGVGVAFTGHRWTAAQVFGG